MAEDGSVIKQIEEGLKRCYALNKKEYDEDDGFKSKCEENGTSNMYCISSYFVIFANQRYCLQIRI